MTGRWCIVRDDSGHDYLCPADRRVEARAAFEAIDRFWDEGTGPPPPDPDFVQRIDGVGSLTFTDPREGS